ncbi:proline iminopeptidase, partial [Bifidobacteriaceae bacterium WP022]
IANSHYWTTNEFEHDGLHGDIVFRHLFDEALNRGDLEGIYKR